LVCLHFLSCSKLRIAGKMWCYHFKSLLVGWYLAFKAKLTAKHVVVFYVPHFADSQKYKYIIKIPTILHQHWIDAVESFCLFFKMYIFIEFSTNFKSGSCKVLLQMTKWYVHNLFYIKWKIFTCVYKCDSSK